MIVAVDITASNNFALFALSELTISKPGVTVPLLTPGAISIFYDDTGLPRANLYVLASIVNSCV